MANALSSKEHVTACLIRLQALVQAPWKTEAAATLMIAAYCDELRQFPPDAITKGCAEWARTKPGWPSLSQLLEVIRGYVPRPKLITQTGCENFLVRCLRVGADRRIDATWVRARHHLLESTVQAHLDGYLTDEHLAVCLTEADSWREPPRMPRPREPGPSVPTGFEATEAALYQPQSGQPSAASEAQAMAQRAEAESSFNPSAEELSASVRRLASII